jgi:hypothetical protein
MRHVLAGNCDRMIALPLQGDRSTSSDETEREFYKRYKFLLSLLMTLLTLRGIERKYLFLSIVKI